MLSENQISDIYSSDFDYLSDLENLNLDYNNLENLADKVLYNNTGLTSFSVANNILEGFYATSLPTSLRTLNLANNRITQVTSLANNFVGLVLNSLNLSGNSLTTERFEINVGFQGAGIGYLTLNNNKLGQFPDFSVEYAGLKFPPTGLNLTSNLISELRLFFRTEYRASTNQASAFLSDSENLPLSHLLTTPTRTSKA